MKRILTILLMLPFLLPATLTEADVPAPPIRQLKDYSVTELVEHFADAYDVSAEEMIGTMKCESGLNPRAINSTKWEYSVGIAQINLRAHTSVTKTQAQDPIFAAEWAAQQFQAGHQKIWTCWRKLYT